MGLCVLYYVEYSLYNVKKVGFFLSRLELRCKWTKPLPKWQILDSSKLKEFADDNFKFFENGRELFKYVENTVGKGEIACYEQFLLSHSVFKRLVLQTGKNQGLFRKGLN